MTRHTDVMRTGFRRARQARLTGAERTCAWCNGCYMVMNMFRLLNPRTPPAYHLVELLLAATGEQPCRQVPARSLQLLAAGVEATARDGFRLARTRVQARQPPLKLKIRTAHFKSVCLSQVGYYSYRHRSDRGTQYRGRLRHAF